MINLLMIIQALIILTASLLCLSQECYNKEEIYTGTKLPYSCKDILANYPATSSGYYSIQPPGASTAVQVYCDMENERCGSKGWTRVANVDVPNVLVTSHSFQAPYRPVEVHPLQDVKVSTSLYSWNKLQSSVW